MAESTSKTPGTFDPEALLAAQRRNIEAFTDAGKIIADGMRRYAEGQVGLMQEAMRDLWGAIQPGGGAPAVTDPSDQLARMRAAFERVLAQVQELTQLDWKSTRLNSSHANISYAVFCLKKKILSLHARP